MLTTQRILQLTSLFLMAGSKSAMATASLGSSCNVCVDNGEQGCYYASEICSDAGCGSPILCYDDGACPGNGWLLRCGS